MSYITAGYAIALSVLALYAGVLWRRRSRLERLAASFRPSPPSGLGGTQDDPGSHPRSTPDGDGESDDRREVPGALRGPA